MNLDYADIFQVRGNRYHAAMLADPDARRAEFEHLFDEQPLRGGETLLDIPAGGGYLARVIGDRAQVTALELTPGFAEGVVVVGAQGDWGVGSFERVVSLAALHHIDDQAAFIAHLLSHVRPGGVLHLADVASGSPLTRFLDGFVGRFTSTGHRGRYLDAAALPVPPGATLRRAREVPCPWRFDSRERLLRFCNDLFGLEDCPRDALEEALGSLVGIREEDGHVWLDWRLLYVDLQPAAAACAS